MRFVGTPLPGAFVIEAERFEDERGFFARTFCAREFAEQGIAWGDPPVGGGHADEGLGKVIRGQTERAQERTVRRAIEPLHRDARR